MESNTPHTFVYSYEEGVERVLNGSYAFLGESTMLDYLVQRNCNLTQVTLLCIRICNFLRPVFSTLIHLLMKKAYHSTSDFLANSKLWSQLLT
jgi:hypothetical protein